MDYLPRRRHPRRPSAGLAGLAALVALAACGDGPTGRSAAQVQPPLPMLSFQGINCGVTFRMIATEDDPLMAQYGIPAMTDTVDVCETWTGSDYDVRVRMVGSSENLPGFTEDVQHVDQFGGSITGYNTGGAVTAPTATIGASSFDVMDVDAATQQASYDDPYYGVYGGGGCHDPGDPYAECEFAMRLQGRAAGSANRPDSARRFGRHGLERRGVRALVDEAEEIAPTAAGDRRFRTTKNGQERIITIQKGTQLLIGEETRGPGVASRAAHTWRKAGKGHVRDRTTIEITETVRGGREMRSTATLIFQDVRVAKP